MKLALARRWHGLPDWRAHTALAVILLLGAALRLSLLLRGVPTLDSDEATVGLMALHTLHGSFSIFFWGQQYMGSLEAILSAPFLWLFGPSSVALRIVPLLLGLAFIATVYVYGTRIHSRAVGLLAALLLALGPPFFVVLSVRAYGGYVETLLFGNLLLLLALHGGRSGTSSRPVMRNAALLGLIAGLALWTNLLVMPYLLVAGIVCWWQRRRDLLGRSGVVLLVGFLLGASPAIIYNLVHGGATLGTVLGLTLTGKPGQPSAFSLLPRNLGLELLISAVILPESFLAGTQAAGLTPQAFQAQAAAHPFAYGASMALTLGALGLLIGAVAQIARDWRSLHFLAEALESSSEEAARKARAARVQMQGTAAILLVAALYAVAFSFTKDPDVYATPRYLLPLYAAMPLLVAQLAREVKRLLTLVRRWMTVPTLAPAAQRWLFALAFVPLLLWNVAGNIAITPVQTAALDHGVWIASQDDQLLQTLHERHVQTVISDDYWVGQRLTFESGETIITVMVTPQGHPGFNRYQPYVKRGLADPRPAYLELRDTDEAQRDVARWRSGKLPGYTLMPIGDYTVLLPPSEVARLRITR